MHSLFFRFFLPTLSLSLFSHFPQLLLSLFLSLSLHPLLPPPHHHRSTVPSLVAPAHAAALLPPLCLAGSASLLCTCTVCSNRFSLLSFFLIQPSAQTIQLIFHSSLSLIGERKREHESEIQSKVRGIHRVSTGSLLLVHVESLDDSQCLNMLQTVFQRCCPSDVRW